MLAVETLAAGDIATAVDLPERPTIFSPGRAVSIINAFVLPDGCVEKKDNDVYRMYTFCNCAGTDIQR